MMIQMTEKVGTPTFAAVVRNDPVSSDRKHQHPYSRTQQRSVHIRLLRPIPIGAHLHGGQYASRI